MYKNEAQFTRAVKKYLDMQPDIFYWKSSDRFQKGVADIIICINGKFAGLELKAPGRCAAPLQKSFGDKILKAGGHWICTDSMAAVEHFIEQLRK